MRAWCFLMLALSFTPLSSAQQGGNYRSVSLHQQKVGTIVEEYFILAGKIVPLPEGQFTLIFVRQYSGRAQNPASGIWPSDLAQVMLYQNTGPNLRAFVTASANLGQTTRRWIDEPCKRTDTIFRLDRENSFNYRADCVLVNHVVNFFSNPTGVWSDVYNALKVRGVSLPVPTPTVLNATITRIEEQEYLSVSYTFNPALFGYSSDGAPGWATSSWHKSIINQDPAKIAFASALSDWAVSLKPLVDEGFKGSNVFSSAIRAPLLRLPLANGQAKAPASSSAGASPLPAPTKTSLQNQAQVVEEKLRELKRLHESGLITNDVYQEQQRRLLESNR